MEAAWAIHAAEVMRAQGMADVAIALILGNLGIDPVEMKAELVARNEQDVWKTTLDVMTGERTRAEAQMDAAISAALADMEAGDEEAMADGEFLSDQDLLDLSTRVINDVPDTRAGNTSSSGSSGSSSSGSGLPSSGSSPDAGEDPDGGNGSGDTGLPDGQGEGEGSDPEEPDED